MSSKAVILCLFLFCTLSRAVNLSEIKSSEICFKTNASVTDYIGPDRILDSKDFQYPIPKVIHKRMQEIGIKSKTNQYCGYEIAILAEIEYQYQQKLEASFLSRLSYNKFTDNNPAFNTIISGSLFHKYPDRASLLKGLDSNIISAYALFIRDWKQAHSK